MKVFDMGLNTEPDWLKADEVIERWAKAGNDDMVFRWQEAKEKSLALRDEIVAVVEQDGVCALNWSCTGETRFNMHSNQWAAALPQYRFEIGRYSCKVFKE